VTTLLQALTALVWLIVLGLLVWPLVQRRTLLLRRAGGLERLGRTRGSRALSLIAHRETYRLCGFPVITRDVLDTPEAVLREIARTPVRTPIDLVLHAQHGHALAAEQIAHALVRHAGRVTVFVPYHATGPALLIALAADEIVLDPNAVLGPVSPQIGPYPAPSLLLLAEEKGTNAMYDESLILADQANKAMVQVQALIAELLVARHPDFEDAPKIAAELTGKNWTAHYPILFEEAQRLSLPVSDALPPEVHALMELYDTTAASRPSTSRW
jgi:ClpP class serine protease